MSCVERCDGNLVHAAHELGIHRRHLYKLIYRERLWPAVNNVRRAALARLQSPPEWLEAARRAVRR